MKYWQTKERFVVKLAVYAKFNACDQVKKRTSNRVLHHEEKPRAHQLHSRVSRRKQRNFMQLGDRNQRGL
jgi:hypothetical protein